MLHVAMTTCERHPPTITRSLLSISDWAPRYENLWLSCDGGRDPGKLPVECEKIVHGERLGPFENTVYILNLAFADGADDVLLFQDDVQLCKNFALAMEKAPQDGVTGFFLNQVMSRSENEWSGAGKGDEDNQSATSPKGAGMVPSTFWWRHRYDERGCPSAVALLFRAKHWRQIERKAWKLTKRKGADNRLSAAAMECGIPWYYPSRSLVQHIGKVSVAHPGLGLNKFRVAGNFVENAADIDWSASWKPKNSPAHPA